MHLSNVPENTFASEMVIWIAPPTRNDCFSRQFSNTMDGSKMVLALISDHRAAWCPATFSPTASHGNLAIARRR